MRDEAKREGPRKGEANVTGSCMNEGQREAPRRGAGESAGEADWHGARKSVIREDEKEKDTEGGLQTRAQIDR